MAQYEQRGRAASQRALRRLHQVQAWWLEPVALRFSYPALVLASSGAGKERFSVFSRDIEMGGVGVSHFEEAGPRKNRMANVHGSEMGECMPDKILDTR